MAESTEIKKTITARIAADKVAELDDLARSQDRERSCLISEAIDQYLGHRRWMVEEIKRAIAEADAGDFLSEEESEAFMKKLAE